MNKRLKRLIIIFFPLYSAAMLMALAYGFYWIYRLRLPPLDGYYQRTSFHTNQYIDARVAAMLTFIDPEKKSGFNRFSLEKPPGTIRVCCFGDSFTYGSEVNDIYDYPSLLNDIIANAGITGVQVINFGIPGFGFHEAFLLWEEVGKRFEPDFVLLGPQCFQWDRDTTFYVASLQAPVHARYILKDDDVVRVEPLGTSPLEQGRYGRAFIPPYRYLRYDRIAPAFINALLPFRHTATKNPFYYYHGDLEEEARKTDTLLLSKIAKSGAQVVLLHSDKRLLEAAAARRLPNLTTTFYDRQVLTPFPFTAPAMHYGPCGNAVIARIFLDILCRRSQSAIPMLGAAQPWFSEQHVELLPLSSYREIGIAVEGKVVGHFSPSTIKPWQTIPTDLRQPPVTSLLAIYTPPHNFFLGSFIPLAFPLKDDEPFDLAVTTGSHITRFTVNRIKLLAPGSTIGVVTCDSNTLDLHDGVLNFYTEYDVTGSYFSDAKASEISLMAGDAVIARGKLSDLTGEPFAGKRYGQQCQFEPAGGCFYRLHAAPDGYLDVAALPETGAAEVWLQRDDGTVTRIPLARWQKTLWQEPLSKRQVVKALNEEASRN